MYARGLEIRTPCRTRPPVGSPPVVPTHCYKQEAEKWDSDSDSDESDEEDLKV